jgi:hypothetical protein
MSSTPWKPLARCPVVPPKNNCPVVHSDIQASLTCDTKTGNWCCGNIPNCGPYGTLRCNKNYNKWECVAPLAPLRPRIENLGLIVGLSVGSGILLITLILLFILR